MIFTKIQLVIAAEAEALKQEIDPGIVCSIVDTMSEWHPERVINTSDSFLPYLSYEGPTEAALRGACIGLTQFTGEQARQLGYKQSLDDLLVPETNLEIGIKLLKASMGSASGQLERALIVMYGFRVISLLPRILSKIKPYQDFLVSPFRPKVERQPDVFTS